MFYMFLISSVLSALGMCARMMYKSKCKEVDFCCIKVVRSIEQEEKLDEMTVGKKEEQ